MSVTQCVYLMSVYRLETLCVTHSNDPGALQRIFMYLEDNIIIRDKFGMWTCITQVAVQVFNKFLMRMKNQSEFPFNLTADSPILLISSDYQEHCNRWYQSLP
ncbi:hypothetical protein AHF37_00419 [Paragonimus kellicotti]|nr:hypothetical protein AHF37_00419 [Paragonimus kellicotti]